MYAVHFNDPALTAAAPLNRLRNRPGRTIVIGATAAWVSPGNGGDCFRAVADYIASLQGVSLAAASSSTRGPARGSLVLAGGVGGNDAIDSAFVALAGGAASHVVVIPTASGPDILLPEMADHIGRRMKERFSVATVTVLHTRDRTATDADGFVEPVRKASGVWILGGFPERLVQAYLGTKTERAIKELLDRGGVVGGESAGAMIQASWLDTGSGFGLLTHAAIFPTSMREEATTPSGKARRTRSCSR